MHVGEEDAGSIRHMGEVACNRLQSGKEECLVHPHAGGDLQRHSAEEFEFLLGRKDDEFISVNENDKVLGRFPYDVVRWRDESADDRGFSRSQGEPRDELKRRSGTASDSITVRGRVHTWIVVSLSRIRSQPAAARQTTPGPCSPSVSRSAFIRRRRSCRSHGRRRSREGGRSDRR